MPIDRLRIIDYHALLPCAAIIDYHEFDTTRQTDLHGNDLYEIPIGEKSSSTPSEGLRRSNPEWKPPERFGDWA